MATEGWSEVRSTHFTFYTDLPVARADVLAVDLELFRAAVDHFTNAQRLDSPIPIRIFVFARRSSFLAFAPNRRTAGWIQPSVRSYDVAFSGASSDDYRSVLYHEYVHFILRNQHDVLYPKWYDEGFAEFLSTTRESRGRLIVGELDRDAAGWIHHGQRPSVEALLDSETFSQLDPDSTASFYAWSWLLVHYLAMDHEYPPGDSFGASMARYVQSLAAGLDAPEALERGWGFDAEELERRLDALTRSVSRGAVPISQLTFSDAVSSRPLPAWEASLRLGELALHLGKHELAREHFELSLVGMPEHPRALCGLGDTYKAASEWPQAEELFEQAVLLAPDDPLTRLDRGEFWLHRAIYDGHTMEREGWLRRARRDFRAVLEKEPDNPEAYAMLGVSQLADGNAQRAVLQLERAYEILPNDWLVQTELMRAYASAGKAEDADRIARRLLVAAHHPDQVRQLRQFLDASRRDGLP